MFETMLGDGLGFGEGPSGKYGGASIGEKMIVGEVIFNILGGALLVTFVFLKEDEVDFFSFDVVEHLWNFAIGEQDVARHYAQVWLGRLCLEEIELVIVDQRDRNGDDCDGNQLKFGGTPPEKKVEAGDGGASKWDAKKLGRGVTK